MRKLFTLLAVALVAGAATRPLMQQPTGRLLFTSMGHMGRATFATSRDGQRIYFMRDSTEIHMYDRRTRREVNILPSKARDLDLSADGSRLTFRMNAEDGEGPYIWVLPLNPATGLSAGAHRRLSLLKGTGPAHSPDGRSIAFVTQRPDTTSSIVVVSANGGPEREVTRARGEILPVQWMPDGAAIYFGLTNYDSSAAMPTGIYRVPSGGGPARLIARAAEGGGVEPGLSPDGTKLMFWGPDWDTTVVTTSDGRRISAIVFDEGPAVPDKWLTNTSTLTLTARGPSFIRLRSFGNGSARTISDSNFASSFPEWSPDGRYVATMRGVRFGSQFPRIAILDTRGGPRRTLYGNLFNPNSMEWSPDGKWLLVRTNDGRMVAHDVNAERSRIELAPASSAFALPRWRSDSRAIIYATAGEMRQDSTVDLTFHESAMNGPRREIGSIPHRVGPAAYGQSVEIINDSLVLAYDRVVGGRGGETRPYRLINLKAGNAERVIYTRPTATGQFQAALSANRQWIAIRVGAPAIDSTAIHLAPLAGGTFRMLTVRFPSAASHNNPWISGDGRTLVLSSTTFADSTLRYYRVDVATGRSQLIATVPKIQLHQWNNAVSPDGATLAFTTVEKPFTQFWEMDVSSLLVPRR